MAEVSASTVCSACPGWRKQTGQGQGRGERGRDIPIQHRPQSIVSWMHLGGQGSPQGQAAPRASVCAAVVSTFPAQVQTGHWFGEQGRTARQSQKPGLRHCHTYVTAILMVLKLPTPVPKGGCFPAWSWQNKSPGKKGCGSNAQRAKGEKPQAYVCPKCHHFGEPALGILAFSMSVRLGADLGNPKTW